MAAGPLCSPLESWELLAVLPCSLTLQGFCALIVQVRSLCVCNKAAVRSNSATCCLLAMPAMRGRMVITWGWLGRDSVSVGAVARGAQKIRQWLCHVVVRRPLSALHARVGGSKGRISTGLQESASLIASAARVPQGFRSPEQGSKWTTRGFGVERWPKKPHVFNEVCN